MGNDDLITESWLSASGWKLQSNRIDGDTLMPGHYRLRPIKHECSGGLKPFQSSDDLCIALAPYVNDEGGEYWHVWIHQFEPYRHIHVRDMRTRAELIDLWEGLTGRKWEDLK